MTSRTAIFSNAPEKPGDNEKLLELFKNRAELKKEFAELRNQEFRLRELIKEKEGATARLQQKLDHLEGLLRDPEWVHTVGVFYQFRALDNRCRNKLAKFAEQLKQQREKRQNNQLLESWKEKRAAEAAVVQRQIGEHRVEQQSLEDRSQAEQRRLASAGGILGFLKRRSIEASLNDIGDRLSIANRKEQELLQQLEQIENRQPPDTLGLDIAAKRSINYMILSFAQQLYLQFPDKQFVAMVKESNDKSIGAINYGGKKDCDLLLQCARENSELIDNAAGFAEALQQRAKLISEHAVFKNDDDAVPVAGTVATLYIIDDNGVIREKDANLLGENYWDLTKVLSR